MGKAITQSPNAFAGGMPSGHAAVSFAGWAAVSFIAADGAYGGIVALISLLMALLVCQSRIESGVHSFYQVAVGAIVGVLVTVLVFQVL